MDCSGKLKHLGDPMVKNWPSGIISLLEKVASPNHHFSARTKRGGLSLLSNCELAAQDQDQEQDQS